MSCHIRLHSIPYITLTLFYSILFYYVVMLCYVIIEKRFNYSYSTEYNVKYYLCIHLIKKRLSSELLHCALRIVAYPDRKEPWM